MDGQACASEGCGSSYHIEPGTYGHVNSALFLPQRSQSFLSRAMAIAKSQEEESNAWLGEMPDRVALPSKEECQHEDEDGSLK